MKKRTKIFITVVAVLLVLVIGAGFVAGNFFYTLALTQDSNKDVVFSAPNNSMGDYYGSEEYKEAVEAREKWLSSVNPQEQYIQSYDDLKLHATSISNNEAGHRWVIVCHGYGSSSEQSVGSGKNFYELGYNVLLPDARGCGESEGGYYGMGWDDRLDMIQWAETIIAKDPDAEIVFFGVSMGGATVMMVSGEELPSNVKAIVEDCGYSSIWDEFSYQLDSIFNLPSFPLMNFASLVTKIRAGYWLEDGSAVKQVAKSTTPMLFIHGTEDTFVPFSMLDKVYEAATCEKEKLVVEGAGHGGSASVLGDEYWQTVDTFLNKYVSAAQQ